MNIRQAGLIINPKAGQGFARSALYVRELLTRMGVERVVTGPAEMGEAALAGGIEREVAPLGAVEGRASTRELARLLVRRGLDSLIVVGGDGTMSDVACVLVEEQAPPPIFGLGVGSTNAGALVSCQAHQIEEFDASRLLARQLPALLAYFEDELVGVGFNDCILGFTVVATIDGRLRDVEVGAKMQGENIPAQPASIATAKTIVQRLGRDEVIEIGRGEDVATVVIGLAEAAFTAKAITGGVCLASLTGAPAGCLVAGQPLVRVELDARDVLALPAIRTSYLSFGPEMRIRVEGIRQGAALCVDGNPLRLLDASSRVEFGIREGAVTAFKML